MTVKLAWTLALVAALASPQVSFEQALGDLASPDASVRLKSVQLLKDAAYLEAATPLAKLITDREDAIQFEAISAELNIFLAEKVVTRKRVAGVVEKRSAISAETTFSAGPLAIGGRSVPSEVLLALQDAIRDDNARVGLEALYAFGALAPMVRREARNDFCEAWDRT